MPRTPVLGTIEVSVGFPPPVVLANSTAPASTALLVFLALPKKSKLGASLKFAAALDGM